MYVMSWTRNNSICLFSDVWNQIATAAVALCMILCMFDGKGMDLGFMGNWRIKLKIPKSMENQSFKRLFSTKSMFQSKSAQNDQTIK